MELGNTRKINVFKKVKIKLTEKTEVKLGNKVSNRDMTGVKMK